MALPRLIKNFNAFVDGISYFGLASTAKLPALKIQTAAVRNGGMDGPVGVDMGTEGLTSEITFSEWSPALLKELGKQSRFVFRPAMQSSTDFTTGTVIATLGGLITTSEPDELGSGKESNLKIIMDVRHYRLQINGEEIYNIDLVNAVRRVGGRDQLAEMRRAMGI